MGYINKSVENGVAFVSVNRPEVLNALNREVVDELDSVITDISKDDSVKCMVIYSKGNFAAGADIKAMVDCDPEGAKAFSFSETFNKIEDLSIPTIAAIEGYALGGGLELALACDIRISAESAKMGFPEITLGIFPGAGGTARAPRLIGMAKAMELIFTGSILSAAEAERIGLVNKAVPEEELLNTVAKMTKKISSQSRVILQAAKRTMRCEAEIVSVKEAIETEAENWAALFSTKDQKEGMRAFIEKRKPVYTDC